MIDSSRLRPWLRKLCRLQQPLEIQILKMAFERNTNGLEGQRTSNRNSLEPRRRAARDQSASDAHWAKTSPGKASTPNQNSTVDCETALISRDRAPAGKARRRLPAAFHRERRIVADTAPLSLSSIRSSKHFPKNKFTVAQWRERPPRSGRRARPPSSGVSPQLLWRSLGSRTPWTRVFAWKAANLTRNRLLRVSTRQSLGVSGRVL